MALAGACDDGAAAPPPQPSSTAGTAGGGTPTAGTVAQAGTGATAGSSMTAGTGAAGMGAAGMSMAAGAGAAGMTAAGAGGGAAGSAATEGFAMCGGAPKEGACKATAPGIYGLKTEVDVWFQDVNNVPPLFDPGRGKLTVYFRGTLSEVCQDGSGGKAIMHPCGTRLPPLYVSLTGGVIQIEFPDDLWDKPAIPDYTTTGSVTGFEVGDTLTVAPTSGLLGLELTSVDAMFPTYMETVTFSCGAGKMGTACFPDADGDGSPGITVNIKTEGTPPPAPYPAGLGEWHYVPAPVDVLGGAFDMGATKVAIGLRTNLGGSGVIGSDCKSGAGQADAESFESRTISCVMSDGTACTDAGAAFVDQNQPIFNVLQVGETPPANWMSDNATVNNALDRSASKGPLSAVVRLADLGGTVTCADVRNAQYPAFP